MGNAFEDAFTKSVGEAMGGVVVWMTVLVFVTTFALVAWLFTRKSLGMHFRVHNAQGPAATPSGGIRTSAAPAQPKRELPRLYPAEPDASQSRKAFLSSLDTAESILATIVLGGLYLGLVVATLLIAAVWLRYPEDGNRDFMLFYCSAVYLLVFLGLIAKIAAIHRRLAAAKGPGLLEQLGSKLQINIQSAPQVGILDTAALERARQHIAKGGTLDEACAIVDPRYAKLTGWARDAFRKAVELALND